MEISSVNQARVFLWMIVCGGVCTFVFDIFRGVRRYKRPQSSVILVQDLALWFIEICLVYAVAFKLNYARVRAYEIVALVIGAVLYFVIFSNYVVRGVHIATEGIAKIIKCLFAPLFKVLNSLAIPVKNRLIKPINKILAYCNVKILFEKLRSWSKSLILRVKKCNPEDIKSQNRL